jgi:integrase
MMAEKGYGQWLGYLVAHDSDALAQPAPMRITAGRVDAFVAHLDAAGLRAATIFARLQGLVVVAKIMGSAGDIGAINRAATRVRARNKPVRDETCGADRSRALRDRSRDPERRSLPVEEWPSADAELWRAACEPAALLDETAGARRGYAAASNAKAREGYGRWLGYLAGRHHDVLAQPPSERITDERVRAFVGHLDKSGVSTGTILTLLQALVDVTKVMDPAFDVGVINRVAARVRARHKPVRDKTCRHLSNELVDLGVELMEQAPTRRSAHDAAIQYRDGLMIAFLALAPLRLRNLTGLVLGRSLVRQGQRYLVAFGEGETKTGDPLELMWPGVLVDPLDRYLDTWRPILAARPSRRRRRDLGDALWVGRFGGRMTEHAIYIRICAQTLKAFGERVNPHAFRHAAATTQAIADPARVGIAAPLLGHRSYATTERYYQRAGAQVAQRSFLEVLEELKGGDERA